MRILKKFVINSPVVLTFVVISFLAYILNEITSGATNRLIFSVYRSSLLSPLYYVRLFGHVFGHADWNHFSGNIMILLLIGPLLEEKYGSFSMALVMVSTALLTGIAHVLLFNTALLGASGIVFALILLSSITSMKDNKIPITFVLVAIIYIGGQVVDGLFVKDNISNLTHILGGGIGCAFGVLLNKDLKRKV